MLNTKDMDKRTYTFREQEVVLNRTTYRNNEALAVLMEPIEAEEGEYAAVTVNLCSPLQEGEYAFVDTNNLAGIDRWLEENGIATHTGLSAISGFCTYPLMKFNI